MIESILSLTHLLLIQVVALIVLGPKRLPEAGRGLGSAIRGIKDSLSMAERREEQPALQPSREPDHTPLMPHRVQSGVGAPDQMKRSHTIRAFGSAVQMAWR